MEEDQCGVPRGHLPGDCLVIWGGRHADLHLHTPGAFAERHLHYHGPERYLHAAWTRAAERGMALVVCVFWASFLRVPYGSNTKTRIPISGGASLRFRFPLAGRGFQDQMTASRGGVALSGVLGQAEGLGFPLSLLPLDERGSTDNLTEE